MKAAPSGLRVESVTEEGRFQGLGDAWTRLIERVPTAHITLTWPWIWTWWRVFGEGCRLYVVLAWDGDELVAAAPLHIARAKVVGPLGVRRLAFLGTGEPEADEVCSEYLDFLVVPGFEEQVSPLLTQAIQEGIGREWDEICLADYLRDESTVSRWIREISGDSSWTCSVQQAPATYLPLLQTWEIMAEHFGPSFRRQIARSERELTRLGRVSFHRATSREEILPALDVLAELHQQRWTSRDRPGCFASERFTRFHREFLAEAAPRGWAEVALLSIDDTPVAALYLFRFRGTMHFYQSGVLTDWVGHRSSVDGQSLTGRPTGDGRPQDPCPRSAVRGHPSSVDGPRSTFRPGIVLHAQAVRWAIDEGFTEYDFMKGASAFKRRWSPAERILDTATLTRGVGRAWAANRLSAGLRTIRRTVGN